MATGDAGLGIADLEPGRGNLFTSANGAASRGAQAGPLLERETTLFAGGRLHNEALRVYRLLDMLEMVEDVSLFDPEPLRNFPQIEGFFFQSFRDLLPQGWHLQSE